MKLSSCPVAGLRIGGLLFRNALPLQFGMQPAPLLLSPAEAAAKFAQADLDLALLPVASVFARSADCKVVSGVAVGADGPVESVILARRVEMWDVHKVYLDPSSRSSVALLQILVSEFGLAGMRTWKKEEDPAQADARLIIGDAALTFRAQAGPEWKFVDLAATWKFHTGLPFVFAVWAIRKEIAGADLIAEWLRKIKADNIREPSPWLHPLEQEAPFWRTYFAHLRFGLDDREKEAISLFRELGAKRKMFPSGPEFLYV